MSSGSQASSLLARVSAVLHSPRSTFEALSHAPRAFEVITLTLFVTLGCSAIVLGTNVGQLALLDRWERMAVALGQTVDGRQYQAMAEASQHGVLYAIGIAVVTGPILTVALSALVLAVFRAPGTRTVTYRQTLSIVGHAGVILALCQVVGAPLTYMRETLSSPLAMSAFFPMLDQSSPVARVLATLDLFVLWWVIVLAIGVSVLYQRPARRVAGAFVGAYVTLSITMGIITAIVGGTA